MSKFICQAWHGLSLAMLLLGYAPIATAADNSYRDCATCPHWLVVPPGSVMAGSHADTVDRGVGEGPKRLIQIKYPLAVMTTELTRMQWQEFATATGYSAPDGCQFYDGHYGYVMEHNWRQPGFPQRPEHPVVCVSVRDAEAYARWLSERTGRSFRLPSASEFEYFNRAGADTPWFWGTDSTRACEYANVGDNGIKAYYSKQGVHNCNDDYLHTAPVGKFKANNFGLYDTVGNVFEWTSDCFHAKFDGIPLDGSAWLEANGGDCAQRSPRGGSWVSGPSWTRASAQSRDPIDYRSFLLGFRLVSSDTRPPKQ